MQELIAELGLLLRHPMAAIGKGTELETLKMDQSRDVQLIALTPNPSPCGDGLSEIPVPSPIGRGLG